MTMPDARLMKLMLVTDPRERNRQALKCADEDVPGTVTTITRLIDHAITEGARGTLLYALSTMVARGATTAREIGVRRLAGIIEDGSYEERQEAFSILETLKRW